MAIGLVDGKLTPCPDSPNCVCSQSADETHAIEPLRYEGTKAAAKERILSVIRTMKHATIVQEREVYLHIEFASALLRFKDDVEFYFPADSGIIHVRSASRVGYFDFGVNRRRIEDIRSRF